MEKKFEYRGDLAATPLPEILATIGRYRVPGALSIGSGTRVRRVFLDGGAVVLATSQEPEVRLGTYLIRRGTLPEEAVQSAEDRLAGDGVRLGQVLLRLELVDQPTLEAAVAEQVRAILWGAFEWDTGEVLFEVGSQPEDSPVRLDLSIPELVVGGVRRSHSVRRYIDRLGSGHSVLERTKTDVPAGLFDNGDSDFLGSRRRAYAGEGPLPDGTRFREGERPIALRLLLSRPRPHPGGRRPKATMENGGWSARRRQVAAPDALSHADIRIRLPEL